MSERGLTVSGILERASTLFPGQKVVSGDGELSYATLHDRSVRLASYFARKGVRRGDVISIADWNTRAFVELLYGAAAYGAVVYPMNIRLPPEQVIYTIKHSDCKWVFASKDFAPLAKKSGLPDERIITIDPDSASYASIFEEEPVQDVSVKGNDVYSILYTSGTTGLPKGVIYSNEKVVLGALSIVHQLGLYNAAASLSSRDVVMPLIPFFHLWAWGSVFHAPYLGAKYVLAGRYNASVSIDMVEKHGVTWINAIPTMVYDLLTNERAEKLRGVKFLVGAPRFQEA